MSKKQLNFPAPHLLDFLKTVDPMVMSQCLFTSQGISAIYSIESKGLFLLGSSESVLAAAESKMKTALAVQTLDVEDQEVLKLHNWVNLKQQLLDTYNSANKRTVAIQIHPERRDKVMVAGFQDPVKEVTRSLKEFIENYSRVQETIRVESCAVVQFIGKKKSEDWVSIAKANDVEIRFDSERPKIILAGARLHVQKAKFCFQELTGALFTDTFIVDKPGAKKYFQTQGSLFLSTIMTEFSCVVLLRPEIQEEEEGEDCEEENGLSYCKVKTTSGVLVSVSKADICSFKVDAVVNAANEELKHIGGLALALLKAAGPELQKTSDSHVARNGKLRPGDAIVTGAYNLPCKHVVHAVGPRFSDFDRKTSVSRLNLAVKRSLTRAEEVNCSTIALPAISSGVFGFPVDLCAETIAQAVREFCDSPGGPRSLTKIHLVDNNDKTVRVLATAVNKEFIDLGPSMTLPHGHQWGRGQSQSPRGRRFSERGGGGTGNGLWGGLQGNSGGHSLRGHARSGGHGGSGRLEQTTAEGLKIVLLKGNIQDQTCFSRAFRGQTVQRNIQHEAQGFNESPVRYSPRHSASPPQQSSASFSQVSSPSLGVYQMKMGQLTLEVSSGDITKEACDVIINSSNQDFTFKSVSSPNYQPSQFIMTSGGLLPSRHIIHVVGQNDPAKIKDIVYSLLNGHQWGRGQSQSPRGRRFSERGGGGRGRGLQGNSGGHSLRGHARSGGHGGSGRLEQTTAEGLKIVLLKGNIQDQTTDVIVNTISEDMNLNQGAVSKAILQAAGHNLQSAVRSEAGSSPLPYGDVVVTDGFNLKCRKVFHTVCPYWNNGAGQAEEELLSIISYCLEEAEKCRMASLSFPALGTGNLSFPKDLVSRFLLQEIHSFSRRLNPRHLREVAIVVHPSDSQTVDCFSRAFRGQTVQRNIQHEAQGFNESPVRHSPRHSASPPQQSSASFSQVSSPSLGVYQMKMGQLTLEVSSGDITKEACDVIINSSNQDFTLKSGVSKAILDSAGLTVRLECSQIVSSPNYQPSQFIMTSGGLLPSRHIIHVVGQNDPAEIKDIVYSLLKYCEENKFKSVSFPALGTGQGGANPSAVADAMVDAVVDFVRKKHPRFVDSVKILIFQTVMMTEFHKSMKKREGEEVVETSVFTKFKDSVTSFFMGLGEERPTADPLVLEGEEFEPTVFQLCADNKKAVSQAKRRIEELIVAEQAERTIKDQYISKLSQADMDQLKALQRKLTVSIRLDRGLEDQEPNIHLEGLTRDVYTAESEVRDIIRKVERSENLKSKALLLSGLVEWQFESRSGVMVPFDIYTNLTLEEALEKKEERVKIKINNETYHTKVTLRKAVPANGRKEVELLRKEVKDDAVLPSHWDDMKGDLLKLFPLTAGSKEYNDVETELKKTGLSANIISIERVQNTTLWQSYQLMKKQLEVKNKHTNNERKLFHGTGANSIDLINKQGFNRSYAGAHGAMIGNGSYFAVNPVYSAQGYAKPDARGHKRMYLARVLVGDFTNGRSGLITPPSKNSGNAADLYDSVADNSSNPTMFVVFNDIQAYPEYLITFT
ncbi:protein mono-ADP-ribosyltransferase PARP14 [Epinephelus moara]|uniref:protein mono-ADP-ribosyltransferase PARP14 n=1 Tax=Epinephelus moara TaxID=300413 RepID=UPI00214F57B9|nr:protein mono-ADP-ribosyltransferase PARP14 [Epinephelus moara]